MKSYVKPEQPWSQRQIDCYTGWGLVADQWPLLTTNQRSAWEAYSQSVPLKNSLGHPRCIGGRSHFIRSNYIRRFPPFPLDWALDGPARKSLACNFIEVSVVCSVDGIGRLTLTVDCFTTDPASNDDEQDHGFFFFSGPFEDTKNYFRGPYIGFFSRRITEAGDCTGEWTHPDLGLFDPAGGEVCFVKIVVTRQDGRLSFPAFHRFITVPD